MSVELFFEDNPVDSRLKERFEKETGDHRSWSLLSHFVESMIAEANKELRNFSNSFRVGHHAADRGTSIEEYVYFQRKREIGAVFLGSSIVAINDSIWTGYVDLSVFYSEVNAGFSGTVFEDIQLTEEAKIVNPIDQQKHYDMVNAALWDKTLTVFLRYPEYLPEKLQEVFCDEGVMGSIRTVLPEYEKRAKLLVASPNCAKKSRLSTGH